MWSRPPTSPNWSSVLGSTSPTAADRRGVEGTRAAHATTTCSTQDAVAVAPVKHMDETGICVGAGRGDGIRDVTGVTVHDHWPRLAELPFGPVCNRSDLFRANRPRSERCTSEWHGGRELGLQVAFQGVELLSGPRADDGFGMRFLHWGLPRPRIFRRPATQEWPLAQPAWEIRSIPRHRDADHWTSGADRPTA